MFCRLQTGCSHRSDKISLTPSFGLQLNRVIGNVNILVWYHILFWLSSMSVSFLVLTSVVARGHVFFDFQHNLETFCRGQLLKLVWISVAKIWSRSLILLFPQENHTFGFSDINLCHLGVELSILRCSFGDFRWRFGSRFEPFELQKMLHIGGNLAHEHDKEKLIFVIWASWNRF
jgi:hypothetical protein